MQLRGMAAQQAADLRWLWSPLPDDHAVFSWKRPRAGRLFAPSGFDDAAALPEIRSLERRPLWLAVLGIVSFALALFWVLVRWLAGRVFGLNRRAAKAPAPPASAQIASGLFVANPNLEICPQSAIFEVVDFRSVDMASSEWRAQIANSKKPGVVLQHLEERFSDPDRRRGKLELLEELIVGCSKLIVVISQIEPLGHLSRRLHSHWDVKADEEISTELIARWARVLERLAWVGPECCVENEPQLARLLWQMYDLRTKATELTAAKLREEAGQSATLVDECQYTARLLGIGWELQTLDEGATADAKDVDAMRRRVANAARAHYQSGWCLLTDEEQLVLVQLANEGFVNPQSWSIVRILVRKGLVRFETAAVRVMNETFRRFVETVEPPEQIKDWERADGASAWDRARHGILLLLIAGGLVLFFTQPEELTRWVGVLTAIGSAAATVMTLFGFFGGARGVPARMT